MAQSTYQDTDQYNRQDTDQATAAEIKPDICVIGAGPGGLAIAAAAAAFDLSCVLVEKAAMGGESLNRGSVPMQALIAAADRAHAARTGAHFGINTGRFAVDFSAVSARVHDVINTVAPNTTRAHLAALGVKVIAAEARFTSARTVQAGKFKIRARHFVIATGSSPVIPAIPGLIGTPYVTDATVFDLAETPRHLIVVGAGQVGLELAQVFRRLGSEVTVLEAATPLADADPEGAAVILAALAREGITLHAGVKVTKVGRMLGRIQVAFATTTGMETVDGSHLLLTTGRHPNIDGLDLATAGIGTAAGRIVVDKYLRSTNKRVYAVGAVAGGPDSTHVSHYHAGLVIRQLMLGMPAKLNRLSIPWVLFTDPELAHVGMLEDEARAHAGIIRVLRWPYRENDRAQVEQSTDGHIKVITDRRGDILGVTIAGSRASESINAWTLAINQKLNIRALAGLVVPYPSYAEVGKRAAISFFRSGLTTPRTRRIMGWLRRLR